MSIDITIKQKLFGGKTMPLEVILGDDLCYGEYVYNQLNVGQLGETEFLAYDPKSIGRGFSVVWNPKEKKKIELRLPQPSTAEELKALYAAVERMVKYWSGTLIVDGNRMPLDTFMAGYDDMVLFNEKIIKMFAEQVINDEQETLTFFSAMWPLTIGKEEAQRFLDDPKAYEVWVHEKQSIDAHYAYPRLYSGPQGIIGRYIFIDGCACIFPKEPTVPFGAMDPATRKPLQCNDWKVMVGIEGEDAPLCEIEYADFLQHIPEGKLSRYDASQLLVSAMTPDEIRIIAEE